MPRIWKYIFSFLLVSYHLSIFALRDGDILTDIRTLTVGERLTSETKAIIRGENIRTDISLEDAFVRLEAMRDFYLSKKGDVPATITFLLLQKSSLIASTDGQIIAAISAYTKDKYERFEASRRSEQIRLARMHERAIAGLPAGSILPQAPSSDTAFAILVDISDQRIYAFEDDLLIATSPITSGKNGYGTVRGDFTVLTKKEDKTLVSPFKDPKLFYRLHVDYWIQFHKSYGLHDACNAKNCWRTEFGGMDYKTRGSHGCVNIPHTFIAWLYHWVSPGSRVRVQK